MEREQFHSAGTPSDQAIEWLARLRADDVTPQETADFATWLAFSSLHKAAFDEATELWQMLGQMPRQSVAEPVAFDRLKKDRLKKDRQKERRQRDVRPQHTHRYGRTLPFAAAASFLVACFIMVMQLTTPNFATGKGEQRRVVLADGSTAFLNTTSEISVSYSDDVRRITLHRGEVWFDVVKQPERPFVVTGQYASAEAVGTAFAVRETPGFTRVGVTQGIVAVRNINAGDNRPAQPRLLREGQQSTISASVTDMQPFEADKTLAWLRGQLVYDNVRLDEVLADLNRYLPRAMTVNDDELAATIMNVRLGLEDQDAILEGLDKSSPIPIRWKSVGDSLIIITPRD